MHKWAFLEELFKRYGGGVWKPYVYPSEVLSLDAGANVTRDFSVKLTDNQGFIWTEGIYYTTNQLVANGSDVLYGGVTIKFDEIGAFGQMGKSTFPLEALFGRPGINHGPRELPTPVFFDRGTTVLSGTLTNKTAGAVDVQILFIGTRRY